MPFQTIPYAWSPSVLSIECDKVSTYSLSNFLFDIVSSMNVRIDTSPHTLACIKKRVSDYLPLLATSIAHKTFYSGYLQSFPRPLRQVHLSADRTHNLDRRDVWEGNLAVLTPLVVENATLTVRRRFNAQNNAWRLHKLRAFREGTLERLIQRTIYKEACAQSVKQTTKQLR